MASLVSSSCQHVLVLGDTHQWRNYTLGHIEGDPMRRGAFPVTERRRGGDPGGLEAVEGPRGDKRGEKVTKYGLIGRGGSEENKLQLVDVHTGGSGEEAAAGGKRGGGGGGGISLNEVMAFLFLCAFATMVTECTDIHTVSTGALMEGGKKKTCAAILTHHSWSSSPSTTMTSPSEKVSSSGLSAAQL
ncbi:hypothetical protein EYF80_009581 [Liparis tanakae]|uniref:Uncharacterized protein n=1 Tax=Liparis tanakae TaxID=230148 RepID=A0A4Z2IQW7_9TELE|nr:hypothetical protein EYF80_009581 [Liparis tanakae]